MQIAVRATPLGGHRDEAVVLFVARDEDATKQVGAAGRGFLGPYAALVSRKAFVGDAGQVRVLLAKAPRCPRVCRKLRATEQTHYRWRKRYGGVRTDPVKQLRKLKRENARRENAAADAAGSRSPNALARPRAC